MYNSLSGAIEKKKKRQGDDGMMGKKRGLRLCGSDNLSKLFK